MEEMKAALEPWLKETLGALVKEATGGWAAGTQGPGGAPPVGGKPKPRGCFECGEDGHFKRECPKYLARAEKARVAGAAPAGN